MLAIAARIYAEKRWGPVQAARSIGPADRVAEHLRVRAGALLRPIAAQQEDGLDLASAIVKADVDFGVTALPAKPDLRAENAAIKLRPFLAGAAQDRLRVSALFVTMADFDAMRGAPPRLRTWATLERLASPSAAARRGNRAERAAPRRAARC